MNPLVITGNETTPKVLLDANTGMFEMSGVAIPEDVRELSSPIITWIKTYGQEPKISTQLTFHFEYLNTAATKMIFEVCESINQIHHMNDRRVKIVWKYFRGDLEMLELGEEVLENFDCITELVPVDQLIP